MISRFRKVALLQIATMVLLGFGLASCGYPSAPECGHPTTDHTASFAADSAVTCFESALKACKSMELDVLGNGFSDTVDEHFIVTPSDHCRVDDYVTHYLDTAPTTALNWQCTTIADLPDWGLVLSGCSPPVGCYQDLGAPVIDPPAVPPSPPPNATPSPVPTNVPPPAPAGAPAVNGQPHC